LDVAAQIVRDAAEQRRRHMAAITQSQNVSVIPNPIRFEDVKTRHAEAMERLENVERLLEQILESRPGIGHNQPPPVDRIELDEIKREIADIKKQTPVLQGSQARIAATVATKWIRISESVMVYLAAKAIEKGAEWLWTQFGEKLFDAAEAILNWANLFL